MSDAVRRRPSGAALGVLAVAALCAWPACRCKPPPRGRTEPPPVETWEPLTIPSAEETTARHDAEESPAPVALRRDLDVRGVVHLRGRGGVGVTGLATLGTDVIASASFAEELAVGDARWPSAGARDGIVLRLTRDGAVVWAVPFAGADEEVVEAVAVAGELVVAVGHFRGTLAIGGTTLTSSGGGDDGFVVGLTAATGELRFAHRIGGTGSDGLTVVAALDDGSVCVAGHGEGAVEVVGRTLEGTGLIGIVGCLAPDGALLGAHAFATEASARVNGIAAHGEAGDVLVSGTFSGTLVDEAGQPQLAEGRGDGFIARLGRDGSLRWVRALGGPGRERPEAVAARDDGSVVAAGSFTGELAFGERRGVSGAQRAPFVAQLGGDGAAGWLFVLEGEQPATIGALLPAADGDVVAVGTFQGAMGQGAARLESEAGSIDVFALRLDAGGEPIAVNWLGGADHEALGAAAWLDDSVLVIGGSFSGTTQLGYEVLSSEGIDDDGFVAFVRAPQPW